MVICSMPECQTTAGCKCNQLIPPTSIRHGKATIRYLPPDPAMADRELIERLRDSTQAMAVMCSAPMHIWNRHSNAAIEAADRLSALSVEVERLKAALEEIAKQRTTTELEPHQVGDFEYAYDAIIMVARAAISAEAPGRKE